MRKFVKSGLRLWQIAAGLVMWIACEAFDDSVIGIGAAVKWLVIGAMVFAFCGYLLGDFDY